MGRMFPEHHFLVRDTYASALKRKVALEQRIKLEDPSYKYNRAEGVGDRERRERDPMLSVSHEFPSVSASSKGEEAEWVP